MRNVKRAIGRRQGPELQTRRASDLSPRVPISTASIGKIRATCLVETDLNYAGNILPASFCEVPKNSHWMRRETPLGLLNVRQRSGNRELTSAECS